MSVGGDFQVQPDDVSRTGSNITEIGEGMSHDRGDLLAQARNVSSGLGGFTLAGALNRCARAWNDELESLAQETRDVGKQLRSTASTYQAADA